MYQLDQEKPLPALPFSPEISSSLNTLINNSNGQLMEIDYSVN